MPTACGSHTNTLIPDRRHHRLLAYVSSYPTLPWYDAPAIACHDIQAFLDRKHPVAAAACNREGQLWDISDPANPTTLGAHTHIRNEAVDFWHSAAFTWDGEIVTFNDEAFEDGACDSLASVKGNQWFYGNVPPGSTSAPLLGRYMIPRPQGGEYCSVHNTNIVPVRGRYVAVSAFYFGGTSVYDFTNPAAPHEIAYFDATGVDGNGPNLVWSSYWYNDFIYGNDIIRGFDVFQPLFKLKARKWHHLNQQTQEQPSVRRIERRAGLPPSACSVGVTVPSWAWRRRARSSVEPNDAPASARNVEHLVLSD